MSFKIWTILTMVVPLLKWKFGDRPLGQWNAFRVKLADDRMTVHLNGDLVLESEKLPDLPATGPIG